MSGDLDTIALKALREEPAERYESVQALAEDVRRHLAVLPISARRASLSYRLRKFVGRHRLGVAAAALVVLALIVGLVGTGWQARVAARERELFPSSSAPGGCSWRPAAERAPATRSIAGAWLGRCAKGDAAAKPSLWWKRRSRCWRR